MSAGADDERQGRATSASAGRRAPAPDDVPRGLVSLVGSGPGDPELLTCRAARRLAEADLVLYDGLVTELVLELAPAAERVCVSRRPSAKVIEQPAVIARMVEASQGGRRVVRLKAGDPFVLGRGGEEALALAEAHVPFEIVPGVTSAVAAPAVAGIPVTHRGVASGFLVVSGHSPDAYGPVLEAVPPGTVTLVVLMGFAERGRIAQRLVERGWPAETPSAIVTNATQADQAVWTGPLEAVGRAQVAAAPEDAHTIVVGEVVSVGAVIAGAVWSSSSRSGHASGSEDTRARQAVVCP